MIDVNPQQVLIIAQEKIAAGWIQGSEHGYGSSSSHWQGVCMVGALRDAVWHVLGPQVVTLCADIPEFKALDAVRQEAFVQGVLSQYDEELISIFRARFAQILPSTIEGWNDTKGRTKAQVLNAMKLALEIVTKECVAEWDRPEEKPEPEAEAVIA